MVRSTTVSPTSTVILLLIEEMDYTLNSHFSRVSVSKILDLRPLGGIALFIDPYGQVRSPQNREEIPCINLVDIKSLIHDISLELRDLHKFKIYSLIWAICWIQSDPVLKVTESVAGTYILGIQMRVSDLAV